MSALAPQTNLKGETITLEDRYLNVKEVTKYCGMARATIYRAMDKNKFPLPHKISEGRVGWLESDIEEYKRVGFLNFCLLYGEKIKQKRIDNRAAIAQVNAA